jgi:hypothetical protein
MQTNQTLAITEAVLKSILQEIGPKNFSIALHNASVHGKVFKENFAEYLDDEDVFLNKWYEGISREQANLFEDMLTCIRQSL